MQQLVSNFIPAADEVWRLQNRDDPDCVLFRGFAEEGHYGGRAGTRQGIYCATPSGRFLASVNSNDPGRMAAMLRQALERWRAMPREERLAAEDPAAEADRVDRFENRYPADGLALVVTCRDLPRRETRDDWAGKAWNKDFLWFNAEEMAGFLPEQVRKGASCQWPEPLARRLVRLNLVDAVRGQTDLYPDDAVEVARMTTEVASVRRGVAEVWFEGQSRCVVAGGEWPRSMETRLVGRGTYDSRRRKWTTFEIAAAGTRSGRTRYNFRENDTDPAPIAFALVLAGDEPCDRVAPAFAWEYGW